MPRRHKFVIQKVFLSTLIGTISLCTTFILLDLFVPSKPQSLVAVTPIHVPHVSQAVAAPTVVASPVQLKIDSINVNATVNPVGLTSAGNMDIDENPTQVAWYKLGPKPG